MRSVLKYSIICVVLICLSTTAALAQKRGLQAIDSIKKELAAHKATDTNSIKSVYRIANFYVTINPDSSFAYTKIGMAQAKQFNFKKAIAGFYDIYGSLYSDKGDFEKAILYFDTSVVINTAIGHLHNLASNLNNIGSAYQRRGDFTQALTYDFKALKIAETIKAYDLLTTLYNNVAMIYFAQKDYKNALAYSFKGLKLAEELGDVNVMASANNVIASAYLDQKKPKQAEGYFYKALDLYKQVNNKIGEASALSQIGLLFENDPGKKLEYLFKAQSIFDALSPQYSMSITNLGNIGVTYADLVLTKTLGKVKIHPYIPANEAEVIKQAKLYLGKAISYSKKVNDRDNLSYFLDYLARVQQQTGDYKDALENFVTARDMNDSLYSQENKNKIASLSAQYAFQKKEDDYKQQQQISELKIRQLILYGILSIVLIAGILMFLLNRSSLAQLRLRNELQKKEAEEQTCELMHRNKLSESELKAIRAQMNPHFIFNVLNSIESYILDNDPKTASRLVQKFASLSRLILENSTQSLVSAEREWKALKLYTELEAMRFSDQFGYSFEVDPAIELSTLLVPPMLVQPLIENSIHHGLRNTAGEGNFVNVNLQQTADQLIFTVEDDGAGIDETESFKSFSAIKSKSIGLAAIRDRVDIINAMNNDGAAVFEIRKKEESEGKGTIAKLSLPKIIAKKEG